MRDNRTQSAREREVWRCLDAVNDPELDESVADMGFVESVHVGDDRKVRVEFRLPTYWCSPNFAFLMAIGIRKAVSALAWVKDADVHLNDHCFDDRVNEGVNSGRAYSDVFAQYCDGADLQEVVETFEGKAFERRQEVVLMGLRQQGLSVERIVSMTVAELRSTPFAEAGQARQKRRYLALLQSSGLAKRPQDKAFMTWQGKPICVSQVSDYLGRLRSTRINMEFNAATCRGLATTRYKHVQIGPDGPTLVDFIAGRVPPRSGAAPGK